jgi:hypothetical protein
MMRMCAPQRVHSSTSISNTRRETPSALSVDLGCVFTLDVDEDGEGIVRAASGWVAVETDRCHCRG